ncbi:MAG: DNA cytosine methyltransferase [Candidatus Hodarchaeota archaeon]
MKILIACEESQIVCKSFRKRGFEAYSCDILPCSGGHPEWHIQHDVLDVLEPNPFNNYEGWDAMIAHPPCTYLSRAGARWLHIGNTINPDRFSKGKEAKKFFLELLNANIPFIAIENPTPLKIYELPKHSQVIQPYMFGHPYSKRTLLWIKGFPNLMATKIFEDYVPFLPSNTGGAKRGQKFNLNGIRDQKEASKTFNGIAQAMAEQWGDFLNKKIRCERQ